MGGFLRVGAHQPLNTALEGGITGVSGERAGRDGNPDADGMALQGMCDQY